jgi:hypothetical protein
MLVSSQSFFWPGARLRFEAVQHGRRGVMPVVAPHRRPSARAGGGGKRPKWDQVHKRIYMRKQIQTQ